jgi:hypothetical protein
MIKSFNQDNVKMALKDVIRLPGITQLSNTDQWLSLY